MQGAEVPRDAVADGVGDVQRGGAGVDRRLQHLAHEVEVGVRVASCGQNSTSSVCSRARATPARVSASTWLGRHLQHVLHVAGAGGDEDVDAGPLGVRGPRPSSGRRRRAACGTGRQMTGPRDRLRRWPRTASKSPWLATGKPASMYVDAEAGQLLGDLELLGRRRGRCPATARRRAAWCRRSISRSAMATAFPCESCGVGTKKKPPGPKAREVSASTGMALAAR